MQDSRFTRRGRSCDHSQPGLDTAVRVIEILEGLLEEPAPKACQGTGRRAARREIQQVMLGALVPNFR
jgi:hypothetical protein